ncbi:MAG: prepilin-type N-terminal cleavage/methylation domain-containing protein [Candidatus Wolfebacteria bacterium]|nr:prepilin-type N-terminal cleavage/methylation domain-containing protein [Candidatus Wolfebacteria bacterium]
MARFLTGFTLIELLIVIGILAVLATIAVLALNPLELVKQARDSQRMADLATLNKALSVYQTSGQIDLGSATKVYVSIPANQTNCSDLGLPVLPGGWTYSCVPSSTLRNINGTGWIPLSFSAVSYGTPLEKLPIDPINTTSTRNYYTYVPGGSWELATAMESTKYKMGGNSDKTSKDGGSYPGLYEEGTDFSLLPIDYGDSSLVGYWKFDEGSGTTAYDSSGYGNTGTSTNGPSWVTGKLGDALQFNGINSNVVVATTPLLSIGSASFSIVHWIKLGGSSESGTVCKGTPFNLSAPGYCVRFVGGGNSMMVRVNTSSSGNSGGGTSNSFSWGDSQWHYVAWVVDRTTQTSKVYIDNHLAGGPDSVSGYPDISGSSNITIGSDGGQWYVNGLIDDVRVYNRALSAAEVAAIYNATK